MGTNYYWYEKEPCACCGREFEPIHIGKSSYGWHFALHVDDETKSLDDWKKRFDIQGSFIKNEYGEKIEKNEMIDNITNRFMDKPIKDMNWLKQNKAKKGINGLARCIVDGVHCVGTEGTYDYITGEFS
jgi:hypothetical protein